MGGMFCQGEGSHLCCEGEALHDTAAVRSPCVVTSVSPGAGLVRLGTPAARVLGHDHQISCLVFGTL